MLAIRFKKVGRKHQISFRIVVAEKRSKRDGKNVEDIGFYNPVSKEFGIKKERLDYWLKNGAKPTPTVYNLLIKKQLISGKKIKIKTKTKNNNQNQTQVDNSSVQENENQLIENFNNQTNQDSNTENNA